MPIDYRLYPPTWHTEIRPRILDRARNRCEWCDAPNGALIVRDRDGWRGVDGLAAEVAHLDGERVTRIVLTVAHLNHALDDNGDVNLAALCQRCHLRHDAAHHARNAAETRRRKRAVLGQAALPQEVTP